MKALVVIAKQSHFRKEILANRTVWLRDAEVPATFAIGSRIIIYGRSGAPFVDGVVESIARFTDLEPVGSGRKRGDVYVRVEFSL